MFLKEEGTKPLEKKPTVYIGELLELNTSSYYPYTH